MSTEVFNDTLFDDRPAGILRGLKKAAKLGIVGFHHAELETSAKAWARAAQSFPRDSVAWKDCLDQSAKFAAWRNELLDGQWQHVEIGSMILMPADWPPPELVDKAIAALSHAQIETLQ